MQVREGQQVLDAAQVRYAEICQARQRRESAHVIDQVAALHVEVRESRQCLHEADAPQPAAIHDRKRLQPDQHG